MTEMILRGKEGGRGSEKVVQHCAANVVQASGSQQRLLWRPTMGLRGAPTAETRQNGRGEKSQGGGGGGMGLQKILYLKTSKLGFSLETGVGMVCMHEELERGHSLLLEK